MFEKEEPTNITNSKTVLDFMVRSWRLGAMHQGWTRMVRK
jgi:hypothetical protein